MKFWFGCRGGLAYNMTHRHQQCNFKQPIFFFFLPRRKGNKNLWICWSQIAGPTYSKQRAGPSRSFWILCEIPGTITEQVGNSTRWRWITPLSAFTYLRPCLCTHTYGTREVGGMGGYRGRFIVPITAFHPLGSTLSQEHRQGLITVCDSRCGAVCIL